MSAAVGMIEVEGVGGIVLAADAACKTAAVDLLGWDSIGGFTTVFFRGSVSDVQAALKSGEAAAGQISSQVVAAPLTAPAPDCLQFVTTPIGPPRQYPKQALGLIETRGYGVHVGTNDQMTKAAAVEVFRVLTVHDRVVCSLIVGDIGAVREAVAVAKGLLREEENFLGAAVIPQPLVEVLQAFGPEA